MIYGQHKKKLLKYQTVTFFKTVWDDMDMDLSHWIIFLRIKYIKLLKKNQDFNVGLKILAFDSMIASNCTCMVTQFTVLLI